MHTDTVRGVAGAVTESEGGGRLLEEDTYTHTFPILVTPSNHTLHSVDVHALLKAPVTELRSL